VWAGLCENCPRVINKSYTRAGDLFFLLLYSLYMKLRPLLRLPAVVFPGQPISFTIVQSSPGPFEVPANLLRTCWKTHGGRLTAFGPNARIGTELRFLCSNTLDSLVASPPNAIHAVGGHRVRLQRLPLQRKSMCEVVPLEDDALSPPRAERMEDEAIAARELIQRGLEKSAFHLESSALDEELGGASVCDPRCHPLFPLHSDEPSCAAELSFWLGARLPLSTSLRVSVLSNACPLRRLQDCVDAMRLLLDPHNSSRIGHKYKIITSHPAHDAFCSTLGGALLAPRLVVAERPPSFTSWSDDKSFPHG